MRTAWAILKMLMLILTTVFPAVAGAAQSRAPAPGPELQKLAYFLGNWKTDASFAPGTFGAGGAFTSTDHDEWMEGGFFLVGRATSTTPAGTQFQLSILGYDASARTYTFSSFNSAGIRTSATGTLNGDTWTWVSTDAAAQSARARHTITMVSASAYTFQFETSEDGKPWSPFIEGKTTKVD